MTSAIAKRAVDVVAATLLLVIALPIIAVSALITTAVLRTSPFFTQTRIGRNGQPFTLFKVRTLPKTTPHYANKYEVAQLHIPAFSRMLRRLHLDELPQLLLVLTGKMSLVGPRPEMPNLYRAFEPDFAAQRITVRPGCTGLWQISEHCDRMIFEHPEYDRYYLEHRSLLLDLRVMARSIRLLLPVGDRKLVTYAELSGWMPRDDVIDLRGAVLAANDRLTPALELQSVEA
ncbi:MAG TPA: sugar transferase [Acidimicrobiales bacterium]|nr:sugar transferase [Acidimicrobiales bacterium]